MDASTSIGFGISREHLVHALYEAAELEHNLMCTYLYAAFSLKRAIDEGLTERQAQATERWRRTILRVATEEMGHLAAVWNITAALGAAPRFGRMNFPLDPGYLPAGIVVKLAPFNAQTLQHFIFLERPHGSAEPEGDGFAPERWFTRGNAAARLTPMSMDSDTVGVFYQSLKEGLVALADQVGEAQAFVGDPALQLSGSEYGLAQAKPVVCLKTALAVFDSIVRQGEGSPADADCSHYQAFLALRRELQALGAEDPNFAPAFPAATNPVLRRPPRPEGRVWLEDPHAVATVDLANASYGLMLRLLEVAHNCPSGAIEYTRRDAGPSEAAPPVNLATVREGGPYAFRGPLSIAGAPAGFRATLCRCGASRNKPYCDGSHHEVKFAATGEPPSAQTEMLPIRDGPLVIDPKLDGPLRVAGNLEIISGTGRVVGRLTSARLCRCGGSQSKPFCDGTHAKIGFRS